MVILSFGACTPKAFDPVVAPVSADEPEVQRLVNECVAEVRREASSAEAHGKLGLVYEANGMWAEAATCFAQAAELDPREVLWDYHRARALGEVGDAQAELDLLRSAADRAGQEAAVHHRLGMLLLRDGALQEARAAFERASELEPLHPSPKVGLAQVELEQGRYDEAHRLTADVVREFPEFRHAHFVHGRALRGMGQDTAAEASLRRGLDSQPQGVADRFSDSLQRYRVNFADRMSHGLDLVQQERFAEAVGVLQGLRKIRPDDPRVLNNLAVAHLKLGQHASAVEILERLVDLDPDEIAAFINLATACRAMGQGEQALGHARRAVEIAPQHVQANFVLAEVLMGMKRLPETRSALTRTVRLDPTFAPARMALGAVALKLNEFSLAIESLEAGLALAPGNLPASLSLVEALHRNGEWERADQRLAEIERSAGDHPKVKEAREQLLAARR